MSHPEGRSGVGGLAIIMNVAVDVAVDVDVDVVQGHTYCRRDRFRFAFCVTCVHLF